MTRLLIATGGGGDAIAAAIIHRATAGDDPDAVIATYAWDRLLVDPLPGPRNPDDFTGLVPIGSRSEAAVASSRPLPPAGSTLPRLSADLGRPLVILDPRGGARDLAEQISDLMATLGARSVELVDVGGDILARGHESTLRTPLADSLVLAACQRLPEPVAVTVAGPGLDGELTEAQVLDRLDNRPMLRLTPEDVRPFLPILDWHPTETTALLMAAAIGLRGVVEIRDAGITVQLTDASANVYRVDGQTVATASRLVSALRGSSSLNTAEEITRDICGFSEIDYERTKARTKLPTAIHRSIEDLMARVEACERQARGRGIDYLTLRRLAEACDATTTEIRALRSSRTSEPTASLWPIGDAK